MPDYYPFACCQHCEHYDEHEDLHETPCDHGCNDAEVEAMTDA